MNQQPGTSVPWQAPPEEPGPAPGIAFASPASRLIAYIVDVVLLGIVITVVSLVFVAVIAGAAASSADGAAVSTGILLVLAVLGLSLAYFPWFWARGGATPGMRMMRIKVVRDRDGGPVTTGQAIVRLVGYWIDSAVFYIGFIWILVDKRRRGWHDLIAGTVVIDDPAAR